MTNSKHFKQKPIKSKFISRCRSCGQEIDHTKKFWLDVDKTNNLNGCWIWKGPKTYNGYGAVTINYKHSTAHRIAYEIVNGPIVRTKNPFDTVVCHTCDNPLCVNPDHLYLGTQAENVYDRNLRGRNGYSGMPGERHHQAKLTNKQILEIRKRAAMGENQYDLATAFGVSQTNISMIVTRKTWKHI